MFLGIHLTDDEAAALRPRIEATATFTQVRAVVEAYLAGTTPFTLTKPGLRNAAAVDPYSLGHQASALSLYHALEPTPAVAALLTDFLRWIPGQEALMWGQNISLGQFLKGAILALDAVGDTLADAERRAILEHLIRTCIDNPDPASLPNNHPSGAQPMKRYLEIPGWGFHLHDAQVNNWDVVCGQGLLYVARAMAAVLPERAAEAVGYAAIARRRLARVLNLIYAPGGEYGEGPGYYSYGTLATVLMLDCLRRWPGQGLDGLTLDSLYATPTWVRQTHPREIAAGTVNVNDCGLGRHEAPACIHWIAARTGDAAAQHLGDALLAATPVTPVTLEDILYTLCWRDPALQPVEPAGARIHHFGRFGTVAARTGGTADDRWLLFRCGDYAGAHTHADRGSLVLFAYGEHLLSDAGMPADRSIPAYQAYHTQVWAHNCALPTGVPQQRERDDAFLHGAITAFATDGATLDATADFTATYPGLAHAERRLHVAPSGWILVHDRLQPAGDDWPGLDVLLHTDHRDRRAEIVITAEHIRLRRPLATLLVFPLTPANARDAGTQYQDADPDGQRALTLHTPGTEMLLLLVPVRAGEEDTVTLTPLAPHHWRLTRAGVSEEIAWE